MDTIPEQLSYDPATGRFTWRVRKQGRTLKPFYGTLEGRYLRIVVDGQPHYAHRLAWLCSHGRWPVGDIDHVNEIKTDNRLSNLREATRGRNMCNVTAPSSNNRSGYRGVSKRRGGFRATFRGEHLGDFKTAEEAAAAYDRAKKAFFL